jgi:putative Mn2+ efflux pump MntP
MRLTWAQWLGIALIVLVGIWMLYHNFIGGGPSTTQPAR